MPRQSPAGGPSTMQILKRSDKTAVIALDQRLTYNQLIGAAADYAGLCGARPEERVVIFSENRIEWVKAFFAIWHSHAVAVPVDAQSTVDEIAYILKDCTPAAIFCSAKGRETIQAAVATAAVTTRILVFEEIVEKSPAEDLTFPECQPGDTAVIIYTSGTTGSPKGVMLTFDNLWVNAEAVSAGVPIYNANDRVLVLLPLHHILPLEGTVLIPLMIGGTCVFSPSMVAADIVSTLCAHKITLFVGVPRLYVLLRDGMKSKIRQSRIASLLFRLAARVNSLAFSRLVFGSVQRKFGGAIRYMPCGGAALDPQVIKDFRTLGFEILMGYGMTETSPMISFTKPGQGRRGSSGQVIPCNEVRCQDGEITVRGRNVMKGYYRRPGETAAIIRDGWLHTGDLGFVDADGHITITGRKKEIIVLPNGKNINPDEVEQKVLGMTDLVAEIAVIPSGDALQALIFPNATTLKEHGILNIEETIRHGVISMYNQAASSYKRILKCTFVSEPLPRTRLGKLKRHELEELASRNQKRRLSDAPEPQTEEYRVIKEFLAGQIGQEVIPDEHFELDLGLDSLGKVSFQVFLSGTFGVEVSDAMLLEYPTPARLAEHLHSLYLDIQNGEGSKWSEILKEKVRVKLPESWFAHPLLNRLNSLLLHCAFRLRGEGIENLPDGPCIITPNHQSYLDGLLVTAFLRGKQLKETYFYAKAEHVRSWWRRLLASQHNVIVMDVNSNLKLSLQKLAEALKKGKKVIIFPEGTRSMDGSLGHFKKTFAILGRELNVPIVPVALHGVYDALPRGQVFPRLFRKIDVAFLKPVYPQETDTYDSLVNTVSEAISRKLNT